jgi:hypothetical protein
VSIVSHLFISLEGGAPSVARAVVKYSFDIGGGRASGPGLVGSLEGIDLLRADNDFLVGGGAEVVVVGNAYSGSDRRRGLVTVKVAEVTKRVAIFGRRLADISSDGIVRVSDPEPFERIAMVNVNAYGGVDGRVPMGPIDDLDELMRVIASPPGAYPRNPAGKGYVVMNDPLTDLELPALEDPGCLLNAQNIVRGPGAPWWTAPLPWNLGYRDIAMFPRSALFDEYPNPALPEDDTLAEVAAGELPVGFRSHPERISVDVYRRAASSGLIFDDLVVGAPLSVEGMLPDGERLELRIPNPARATFRFEGALVAAIATGTRYVVDVESRRLDVVRHYLGELPRSLIPGIHKHIPLALEVEGVGETHYEAPPPMSERVGFALGGRQP